MPTQLPLAHTTEDERERNEIKKWKSHTNVESLNVECHTQSNIESSRLILDLWEETVCSLASVPFTSHYPKLVCFCSTSQFLLELDECVRNVKSLSDIQQMDIVSDVNVIIQVTSSGAKGSSFIQKRFFCKPIMAHVYAESMC